MKQIGEHIRSGIAEFTEAVQKTESRAGKALAEEVKEGDRVLFGKYSGSEIKIDGEELLIMKEDEILGILSGSAKSAEKPEKAGAARR